MEYVIWFLIAYLVFVLLAYPMLMILVGIFTGKHSVYSPTSQLNLNHKVSVIIAACNEVNYLEQGIVSIEKSDYPNSLMDIIVVTDEGSSDGTGELADQLEKEGRIKHIRSVLRGKNHSLDFAVNSCAGDILVFKDATGLFEKSAISIMISSFDDPNIGCVGGSVIFRKNKTIGALEHVYWKYEQLVRRGTIFFNYLPSAAGGIHAMRKTLYQPVPNNITRDMIDPVQGILYGHSAIKRDEAICYEEPWGGAANVYTNRLRVTQRAWAAIKYCTKELLSHKKYIVLGMLIIHKILRFLLFIPLALLLLFNLIFVFISGSFTSLLVLQIATYFLCILSIALSHKNKMIPIFSFMGYLALNIFAMGDGTIRYLIGKRTDFWK